MQGYDLAIMMAGALEWKDRGSLGSIGSGDEEWMSPSVLMSSWSAWSWSSAQG